MLFRLVGAAILLTVASVAFAQSAVEGYVTGGAGQWVHSTGSRGSLDRARRRDVPVTPAEPADA